MPTYQVIAAKVTDFELLPKITKCLEHQMTTLAV